MGINKVGIAYVKLLCGLGGYIKNRINHNNVIFYLNVNLLKYSLINLLKVLLLRNVKNIRLYLFDQIL